MNKSEGQVLDFDKICRLCLVEKRSMSAIFSKKKSDKKVPLSTRIMSCASLELYEGDGLPASICNKCLLSVNQSFAFREQCEQADSTLRLYAQRMNEANGEPSTNRERGKRIANISLVPIADVGIRNNEGSGDGRGVGGGIEEKDVVEQDEKCHRGENDGRMFGLGISSFVSEDSSSSKAKGDAVGEQRLGNQIGLPKNDRKKELSSTKAKPLGLNKGTNMGLFKKGGVETLVVGEKLRNVLLVNNQMKRVSDCTRMDSNESEVKEKEGMSESSVLRTDFVEKAEDFIVVADIETISTNFLSDVEGGSGSGFKKSMFVLRDYDSQGNVRGNESAVKNSAEGEGNSVNDVNLQLLQKLIKNKEIIVQKKPPSKILIVKKESGQRLRQTKESFLQDFKVTQSLEKLKELDIRLPHFPYAETEEIPKSNNETQIAKKLIPKERKKPEIIIEECTDEKSKNEEERKEKRKHRGDTVFCKDCKIFLLRSSYCNHIKFVHNKVRKYLCQSCGYAACTGTILRQHVQAVHDGYSFYCDQCPRKFNLMKRLRKHMEVEHMGKPVERNHVCQYCAMAFTKPAYLKRHLRSHTQETPYQCRFCHRRFKYHWPKVQHERLHTGEKPYKCSFCGERFTQNCVRKSHEYKKHGNEEFKPKTRAKKSGKDEI